MKKVFVVDGNLEVHLVQVSEVDWNHGSGVFPAKIGQQSIIVQRGGWTKFTTYGGFAIKEEAEQFKALMEQAERGRR